jgi:hypothetical protein
MRDSYFTSYPLLPIYLYHWHHVFTDVEWKWCHFLQTDTTTFQANNPQCSVWRTNWSHKMLLAQLPLSAQYYSSSPFLDLSLFSYDYKCESVMERHKSCGEHRIRYTETTMNGSFKSNKYILKHSLQLCVCVSCRVWCGSVEFIGLLLQSWSFSRYHIFTWIYWSQHYSKNVSNISFLNEVCILRFMLLFCMVCFLEDWLIVSFTLNKASCWPVVTKIKFL